MKQLYFDYSMLIAYATEVSKCNFTIKCFPQNNARQTITDCQIQLQPPTQYCEGVDGLGNRQIYGLNEAPHDTFFFRITGSALVGQQAYEEEEDENYSMIFRHPHGLNCAGEQIRAYYKTIPLQDADTPIAVAERLMDHLHADFSYQVNSTTVNTTAEEAFSQGYGVCQDYAHIFLALLHLAGISARYVTGLLIGEGASHAWVEVLQDHKWYGFDPTNHQRVYDNHIKIGVGRDAKDCMINRGIMHGGGLHTQTINVSVKEVNPE